MSAATATIITGIGMGVKAGMDVYGAHKASNAAKEAAKIQTGAADEALGVSKDVYNRQMYAMDPYANVGRQAMSTIGRLTAPGQPYTPQLQRQDAQQGYTGYGGGQQPPMTIGGGPGGGMAGSRPAPPGPVTGGGKRGPFGGMGNPTPPPGGDMVLLQAPDGSQRPVPSHQVQGYLARGATVVQQ